MTDPGAREEKLARLRALQLLRAESASKGKGGKVKASASRSDGPAPTRARGGASLEDEIGRRLAEAEASGELQAAPSYGRPLQEDEGWQRTPEGLRMAFKALKDAGIPPPEIELLHQRRRLREAVQAATEPADKAALQRRLAELEQVLAMRLESLRRHG